MMENYYIVFIGLIFYKKNIHSIVNNNNIFLYIY